MALPKLKQAWFKTKLLSTGKEVRFRPFSVGEQKRVMLVRSTSKNDIELYKAIIEMAQNCVEGVDTPLEEKRPKLLNVEFFASSSLASLCTRNNYYAVTIGTPDKSRKRGYTALIDCPAVFAFQAQTASPPTARWIAVTQSRAL